MTKILVIEDEEAISELIRLNLNMVGYSVAQAMDGQEGLDMIHTSNPDLILLDLMLPKIDGYDLLPEITSRNIPVILLTAKDSLKDKVKGFSLGADDYITKPFEGMELIARIKAVLRRTSNPSEALTFDDITMIPSQRKVYKGNNEVELTLKEFDLLKVLAENKGVAFSREKLLELVWATEFEGNTRTVDMHIQRLRSKLHTEKITTVYKIGYRLEV
jgi:DNA-binding response OmpR family regulator